jgi:hypothetical protein
MKLADFFRQFRDDQEIGRDITDERLDPEHADAARDWCTRQHGKAPSHVL